MSKAMQSQIRARTRHVVLSKEQLALGALQVSFHIAISSFERVQTANMTRTTLKLGEDKKAKKLNILHVI